MKVFIRGDIDRGKEVIETLTNLGAVNRSNYQGDSPKSLYYVDHKRGIRCSWIDNEVGKIIMDNYSEIKLPEQWKDGDVLIKYDFPMYAIFSHIDVESTFIAYMQASEDGVVGYENGVRCNMENYRLATDEEVNRFYEILHKHDKYWDDEAKILVEWKFEPKIGEDYFYFDTDLSVGNTPNDGLPIDESRIRCGNCFRTMEEGEAMVGEIKRLLEGEAL